jgi:hypothetical protein
VATGLGIPDIFPKDADKDYPKLLQAAQKGDQRAYKDVTVQLDRHPEVWERIGDMTCHAPQTWVDTAAQGNLVVVEGIHRQMRALREELSGTDPSPLERLLIEMVVLCWLQVHYLEQRYAALLRESHKSLGGDQYQKRLDWAHYRYLAAIRSLAVVRNLLTPSIRVSQVGPLNVSDKAGNVVGTSVGADPALARRLPGDPRRPPSGRDHPPSDR